jgi:DNA-binding transcriptional ArsR family regulator
VVRVTVADDVFAALASPPRREVLQLLLGGPRTVNDLASHFDMRRPSLSEHLRVLREAGLVSERKVGRERHYQLESQPFADLGEWLHPYERFWRERLTALHDVLEDM